MKNLPEKKYRAGAVCATVWSNPVNGLNGEPREFKTISLERNYKDKNNEWKQTSSMRLNDLPKAILVLQKAYEHIAMNHTEEGE